MQDIKNNYCWQNNNCAMVRCRYGGGFIDIFWGIVSSHVCRRSFCTNMFLSGVPAEKLMKISGHKNSDSFLRYIKIDNLQAANMLKEHRNNKNKKN